MLGIVEQTAPVVLQELHLQNSRVRPVPGGYQINFLSFQGVTVPGVKQPDGTFTPTGLVCTLGFNVIPQGPGVEPTPSYVTNSHCTGKQGGTEGTRYYQPLSSIDPTVVATEAADPGYFTGGACPQGRKCRYSDAARALYSSSVASTRGAIAKTSAPNNNSIDVTGTFSICALSRSISRWQPCTPLAAK